MTTADKLNKLLQTKEAIRLALIEKGQNATVSTPFADYANMILGITTETVDNELVDIDRILTDSGEDVSLSTYLGRNTLKFHTGPRASQLRIELDFQEKTSYIFKWEIAHENETNPVASLNFVYTNGYEERIRTESQVFVEQTYISDPTLTLSHVTSFYHHTDYAHIPLDTFSIKENTINNNLNALKIYWATDSHVKASVDGEQNASGGANGRRFYYTSGQKLQHFVDTVNDDKPDLVYFSGDLTEGDSDPASLDLFMSKWNQIEPGIKKELTVGNHDMAGGGAAIANGAMAEKIGYGNKPLVAGSKYNQSFYLGNEPNRVKIISVDTNIDETGKHIVTTPQVIKETVRNWIKSELLNSTSNKVIIASHGGPGDTDGYFNLADQAAFKVMIDEVAQQKPELEMYSIYGHKHTLGVGTNATLGTNIKSYSMPPVVDNVMGRYTVIYISETGISFEIKELKYPYPENQDDKTGPLSGVEIFTDKADNSVVHVDVDGKSYQDGVPTPEYPIEIHSLNDFDVVSSTEKLSEGQLEEYNYDTEYENIYKTNISLSEPLRSVGDIKDRLFRDSDGLWKIERNVGETVLDGSETWVSSNSQVFYTTNPSIGNIVESKEGAISNKYKSAQKDGNWNIPQDTAILNTDSNRLYFFTKKEYSSLGVWKNYLGSEFDNNTPVVVQYLVANPILETLDQELQNKLNNLRSFKDSNYVYTIINDILPIVAENLKPTLHATFKSKGWYDYYRKTLL